jgi:hypothetical protein
MIQQHYLPPLAPPRARPSGGRCVWGRPPPPNQRVPFTAAAAGVGLSLADDPKDYVSNDTRTAADSEEFLRRFFARHPELGRRPFFISGAHDREGGGGGGLPLLIGAPG